MATGAEQTGTATACACTGAATACTGTGAATACPGTDTGVATWGHGCGGMPDCWTAEVAEEDEDEDEVVEVIPIGPAFARLPRSLAMRMNSTNMSNCRMPDRMSAAPKTTKAVTYALMSTQTPSPGL